MATIYLKTPAEVVDALSKVRNVFVVPDMGNNIFVIRITKRQARIWMAQLVKRGDTIDAMEVRALGFVTDGTLHLGGLSRP
jgi:hypothetical protein